MTVLAPHCCVCVWEVAITESGSEEDVGVEEKETQGKEGSRVIFLLHPEFILPNGN